MKIISQNVEETHSLAKRFIHELTLECKEMSDAHSVVIGLYGDLGSGKTAFVQGLAKELGITEKVISPTFIIQKKYQFSTKELPFKNLIHIDTYRLEGGHEMEHIRWKELVSDPKNLIVMEWASKVEEVMPDDTKKIFFTFIDENKREIEW